MGTKTRLRQRGPVSREVLDAHSVVDPVSFSTIQFEQEEREHAARAAAAAKRKKKGKDV